MSPDPKNILLINFGQIGDVILSLSATRAVIERFAESKITLAVGKSALAIIEMSGLEVEIIAVDRITLQESNKFWSFGQIVKLVRSVRKERFDFVIDLHSFPETNLLGLISGAKTRLYSKRNTRSLDFLSNFRPEPPADAIDGHITEFYARSVEPLKVNGAREPFLIVPSKEDETTVKNIFAANKIDDRELVGINVGAGHPTRASNIGQFGKLAEKILRNSQFGVVVFAGPEETGLREKFYEYFPEDVVLLDSLNLKELAAAFSKLEVVIGNDTGPIHLAAAVGTSIVMVAGREYSTNFTPLTSDLRVVAGADVEFFDITEVFDAVRSSSKIQ